jgi:putative sterol carrier protein
MTDIDPQAIEQMAQAVGTMSDEDVQSFASAQPGGPRALLQQVFDGMCSAYNAEKAAGLDAVVQWEITTSEGPLTYHLRMGQTCEVSEGEAETPRVTLKMGLPDFLRLVLGALDGIQAFMSGKLQLVGDVFFAQSFQTYFDRPAGAGAS